MFDPVPRILSGRGVLNRLERLDGEADRRVADRMGRGLETGTVRRGEDGTKLGWRVNEDPPLSRPSDVWSREGGGVGPERAVREDLNRAEPEPRIPEPRSESRIHERRQHGVVRHRVHSEAEGPRAAGALVRGPPGSGHDIVDRRNPEAMGHSRNGGEAAPDPRLVGLEPPMELPERVLRQDDGWTAGGVDLEAPRASQIRRELEGLRIQRSEVAVDSARDDGVVGRGAIEVLPEEETPLRPLRLVPIDSDNPVAQRRRCRGLPETADGIGQVASRIEPRPSPLARGVGHVRVGVDETREDDGASEVHEGRVATAPSLRLRRRPDGHEAVPPNGEGLRPRSFARGREDLAVDEDDVRVAPHLSARPANPRGARSLRGASRLSSRT